MTTFRVLAGDELDAHLDAVGVLMEESYQPGSARMDAAYLRWALRGPAGLEVSPFGVCGFDDAERPVAFLGVTPRPVVTGSTVADICVSSFTAVHPSRRGGRLTGPLFAARRQELMQQASPQGLLVSYARDGSAGFALEQKHGRALGWSEHVFAPLFTWGLLRTRHHRPSTPVSVDLGPAIRLDASDATTSWLTSDPRLIEVASSGIRVVLIHSNARDTAPVAAMEGIPSVFSTDALMEAVELAKRALPADVRQIVVSGAVPAMDPVLTAVGFRRVPGPAWRSSAWIQPSGVPAIQGTINLVPIT